MKSPLKSPDWALEVTCRVQIANMLISAGALVDVENNNGRLPLTYGCSEIRERVEDFMRKNKDAVKTKFRSSFTFDHPVEVQEALQGLEMPCGVCFLAQSCQSAALSTQVCVYRLQPELNAVPSL
ncbi:uncharacterized protein LOC112556293 [Pomacea canaliculata]|uniref:uncharacterized protein LOC112556293 n=1 Tax=Pomacea canaliculata TaxID=400727 RepID=UPI000D73094C|nr:uncharacterized protein LOC112556293 [Pomacea canaliculata]